MAEPEVFIGPTEGGTEETGCRVGLNEDENGHLDKLDLGVAGDV